MEPGHLNMETRVEAISLKRDCPDIAPFAYISGSWVWVKFPSPPGEDVIKRLRARGYSYASKKREWYNTCGVRCRKRKGARTVGHVAIHGAVPIDPDNDRTGY